MTRTNHSRKTAIRARMAEHPDESYAVAARRVDEQHAGEAAGGPDVTATPLRWPTRTQILTALADAAGDPTLPPAWRRMMRHLADDVAREYALAQTCDLLTGHRNQQKNSPRNGGAWFAVSDVLQDAEHRWARADRRREPPMRRPAVRSVSGPCQVQARSPSPPTR